MINHTELSIFPSWRIIYMNFHSVQVSCKVKFPREKQLLNPHRSVPFQGNLG